MNDKIKHLLLSILLVVVYTGLHNVWSLFNWSHAISFVVCIELVQIDVFGIKGRWLDTIADLCMDAVGIAIGLVIMNNIG